MERSSELRASKPFAGSGRFGDLGLGWLRTGHRWLCVTSAIRRYTHSICNFPRTWATGLLRRACTIQRNDQATYFSRLKAFSLVGRWYSILRSKSLLSVKVVRTRRQSCNLWYFRCLTIEASPLRTSCRLGEPLSLSDRQPGVDCPTISPLHSPPLPPASKFPHIHTRFSRLGTPFPSSTHPRPAPHTAPLLMK